MAEMAAIFLGFPCAMAAILDSNMYLEFVPVFQYSRPLDNHREVFAPPFNTHALKQYV